MIHRLIHALTVLLAVVAFGLTAHAQQRQSQARFAFVIGNDSYDGAELPTAANDAALIAEMLKSAGFDVTGARNLDQETLRASYREFLEKVAAGGSDAVAFVYISGYGMQSDGENYFIPPGARIARAADLTLNGVRLTDVTRSLGGLPAQARIMVFDLAYAGPFAREGQAPSPGLAIMEAGPGDLVAFNAAPGAFAPIGQPPYGAFAQALAEMAREPGTPIADVFNRVRVRVAELTKGAQVPWRESRIETPIVLFDRAANAPEPAVSQADLEARRARPMRDAAMADAYALALDRDTIRGYEEFLAAHPSSPYARNVRNIIAARREALTWRRTVQVNTAPAYWSYLDRYPKGPNAASARARLARLQAAVQPPPRFDAIEYDIAPPPSDEAAYFAGGPGYFAPVEAPIDSVYLAPAPSWWRPPPPPEYVEDSHYFLPMPEDVVTTPDWISTPSYVVRPERPVIVLPPDSGYSINPYVAAPIALAAGIAAGSIIYRRDRLARPGAGPGRPFLPPVAVPPRGRPLPAALQQQNLQNFQQRPRPINNQGQGFQPGQQGFQPGQQGVRPGQQGFQPGQQGLQPGQQGLRPGQQGFQPGQQGLQPGQQGLRPGQQGFQPGQQGLQPGQQGLRPGQQGFQPGQQGLMPGQAGGQGGQRPLSPQERQRQLQMERQQQQQMQRQQQIQQQQTRQQQQRELQMQRQQQQRDAQQQRQQQREQQRNVQQQRQQQMQQQRQEQLKQQQGRQQQMQQQQREQQMQRQQQLQQQQGRQQQIQQQRQQQLQQQQQQRQQQLQQQQGRQQQMQQQQRQQQMQQQQQRQQQMQQQQQRQQQMQQQQRQQQMQQVQQQRQQQMQQQRQQQMQQQQQRQQQMQQQQRQQQQRQACGRPGLPACR